MNIGWGMTLANTYAPHAPPITFPPRVFLGDARIIHCRLDIPLGIDDSGHNGVRAWCGLLPLQ
jgi:hypothetical protein